MTKAKVTEELGIVDIGMLKVWMRRYNRMGILGWLILWTLKEYIDFYNHRRALRKLNKLARFYTGTSLYGYYSMSTNW